MRLVTEGFYRENIFYFIFSMFAKEIGCAGDFSKIWDFGKWEMSVYRFDRWIGSYQRWLCN